MKTKHVVFSCLLLLLACGKNNKGGPDEVLSGDIKQATETSNGVTYKIFTNVKLTTFKGILVMGIGNNENSPTPGLLDGAAEHARITDNSCDTHCGGNWTDKMYAKMVSWLQ